VKPRHRRRRPDFEHYFVGHLFLLLIFFQNVVNLLFERLFLLFDGFKFLWAAISCKLSSPASISRTSASSRKKALQRLRQISCAVIFFEFG
jgi:hypothetical protein